MTEAATRFIAPLTLQTLSGNPVARDLFDLGDGGRDRPHPPGRRGRPAGRRARDRRLHRAPGGRDGRRPAGGGRAGDAGPVLLAPAMNVNMWENPLTQANLARLLGERGGRVLDRRTRSRRAGVRLGRRGAADRAGRHRRRGGGPAAWPPRRPGRAARRRDGGRRRVSRSTTSGSSATARRGRWAPRWPRRPWRAAPT